MCGSEWIVVVTDRPLHPCDRGNRVRIVEVVSALRGFGFRLAVVTARASYTDALRRIADDVTVADEEPFRGGGAAVAYEPRRLAGAVAEACKRLRPLAVIAEYVYLAKCLDAVPPPALRVIDTHDVMHIRCQFDDTWVSCTRQEERDLLLRADVVIAIQPNEGRLLSALLPERRVVVVGHSIVVAPPAHAAPPGPPTVMMVGSSHPGNAGIRPFLEEAWPCIRSAVPGVKLVLHGSAAAHVSGLSCADVLTSGFTPDLAGAYRDAHVAIAPLVRGTGLKLKVVEALAHRKAVVTTRCGSEGLEDGTGVAFAVHDEWAAFADEVRLSLADPERRAAWERRAADFAALKFGRRTVFGEFVDALRRSSACLKRSPGST